VARPLSRRRFLQAGAGLVGGALGASALSPRAEAALATAAPAGSKLTDIEHVVIFMQENRSFDHYFGTLSGVLGFDDPHPQVDATGRSVFEQLDPAALDGSGLTLLPFHLDTRFTSAQCLTDVSHGWQDQHFAFANGANNRWLTAHYVTDGVGAPLIEGDVGNVAALQSGGARVMGYHTRADLPFHYALADGFTVCDRYFCSVLGQTNPNRLMMMSATLDLDGTHGGPAIDNSGTNFSWLTYPERLQKAGIDWYVYRERDDFEDNMLDHFVAYEQPGTELHRRGRSYIPDGQLPARLRHDVVTGNLPQVSWIVGPTATTEHPDSLPALGAQYTQRILEALTADPKVWAKTLLILTYDENGGFFDHVIPPVPPPGTPGEYLSTDYAATHAIATLDFAGPVGLGFRVPTILISPFTRGGYLSSDTFDHTSILRFLETRFGVEVPNLNAWRRATCGDLTSAINFAGRPSLVMPKLPDTAALLAAAQTECRTLPAPTVPRSQSMPTQEPGVRPRPSGIVKTAQSGAPAIATVKGETLAVTGRNERAGGLVAAAALAGALALRRRGGVGSVEP